LRTGALRPGRFVAAGRLDRRRVFGIGHAPGLARDGGGARSPTAATISRKPGSEAGRADRGDGSLSAIHYDKYGRRVDAAIALPDGRDIGRAMLVSGHAKPMRRSRVKWC